MFDATTKTKPVSEHGEYFKIGGVQPLNPTATAKHIFYVKIMCGSFCTPLILKYHKKAPRNRGFISVLALTKKLCAFDKNI